ARAPVFDARGARSSWRIDLNGPSTVSPNTQSERRSGKTRLVAPSAPVTLTELLRNCGPRSRTAGAAGSAALAAMAVPTPQITIGIVQPTAWGRPLRQFTGRVLRTLACVPCDLASCRFDGRAF